MSMVSSPFFAMMLTAIIATFFHINTEATEWIVTSNESLADAIRNVSIGDTVMVHDGLYRSCNQIIRASNVTIQALSDMKVTIDCNQSSSHLIIYGENVRVKGIVFINGFSVQSGGCVKVVGKGAVFQNCRFERCRSSMYGGGIFLTSTAGNVTIFNLEIMACKAVFGGGMYADMYVHLRIHGRTIFKENAASQFGGGICLATGSRAELDVQTCDFHGNSANANGGGIYSGTARISISGDVRFTKNSAVAGGALLLWASLATFESSSKISFKENSGIQFGGAVLLASGSVLHSRSSISFEGKIPAGPFTHTQYI
jgi:predicted outer membrane repeat protein